MFDPIFTPTSTLDQLVFGEPSWGKPATQQSFESSTLAHVLLKLRRLVKIKAANKFDVSKFPNGASYTDQVYSMQKELSLLSNSKDTTLVEKCCCLAALIYIHVGLCDMSFDSRAVEVAVDKLYDYTERLASPECLNTVLNQELVYKKAFGFLAVSYVASGGKQRQLFVKVLKIVCVWINYKTALDWEDLLDHTLWDKNWSPCLPQLWKEVDNQYF
jgi:hypothetical protein